MMHLIGVLPYWTLGPWNIGPLTIHSFGLAVAIGLMFAFTLMSKRGERVLGVHGDEMQSFALWLVAIGWVFSHVFNVIFYEPHLLREDPLILFKVWGSISSYGGMLGGMIALYFWHRRHPQRNVLDWANVAVWSLPVGWFFGRIGCALVHDHPGRFAHDFWLWEKIKGLLGADSVPEIWPLALQFPDGPRHDLGFYEAIWWGVIFAFVLFMGRKPRRRGFYLWSVPMLYAPARFLLDFMRVAPAEMEYGGDVRYLGLTPGHYISIALFVLAIVIWYRCKNFEVMKWTQYEPTKSSATKSSH